MPFFYKEAGYSYIRSEIGLSHIPMLSGMVKIITYYRDRKENQGSNRFVIPPSFFTTSLCAPTPCTKVYRKQSPALSLPVAIQITIQLRPHSSNK